MNKQTRKRIYIWVALSLLLIFVIVFLMFLFFSSEKLVVTGELPQVTAIKALSCEKANTEYPFFEYDESTHKKIIVSATFDENDELENISLRYSLYYDDAQKITDSENINHVAMSKSFSESGLEFDALGSQYSKGSDVMQFSLTASADKLTSSSAKYFMLNDSLSGKYTKTLVEKGYKNKGFSCATKND